MNGTGDNFNEKSHGGRTESTGRFTKNHQVGWLNQNTIDLLFQHNQYQVENQRSIRLESH